MPITEPEIITHSYPLAKRGVNLYRSIQDVAPDEALLTQNCIYRNGIIKRGGQEKLIAAEVSTGKAIVGLHRFYYGSSSKQLLVASNTDISYRNGSAWTDIGTSQTAGLQTHFTTWRQNAYATNGTDKPLVWNGSAATNGAEGMITILDFNDLDDETVTIQIDGTSTTLTEGVDWDKGASNNAAASSLDTALEAVSGVTSSVNSAIVTVGPDATNNMEALSSNSDVSDLTVSVVCIPRKTIQLLPYLDRLLAIDANNEGVLTWSSTSYTTVGWETADACNVKPDSKLFGMAYHSISNVDSGYETQVLLAGANGMYLFRASDLRTPFTTGTYVLHTLATTVGCNAPRTMIWTPIGTMYLGIDRQVYLLQFGSSTPVPVSDKVRSTRDAIEGIEKIPASSIPNAAARYHDGFYKLSITVNNGSFNTTQWWLDVNRIQVDEDKLYGPWYGPMTGQSIAMFVTQDGPGDKGELIGGEADANVGSFVYKLGETSVKADVSKTIPIYYKTYHNFLGNEALNNDIHNAEFELLNTAGTVSVEFHDTTKVFGESLWVCDSESNTVYNIKADGTLLSSFLTTGFDASATSPQSVALDSIGNLWIIDTNINKVYNVDTSGSLISGFTPWLTTVLNASATSPTGIALAADDTLWITDSNTDTIYHAQASNGTLISSFATSAFDREDLWYCDADSNKIYNIEKDGTLISSFATSVFDVNSINPSGVSIDDDDTLWVCDITAKKIYNIEKDGTLISSFATVAFDAGATLPAGISTSNDDTLWVCDANTDKIYNIEKDGTLISSFATSVFDGDADNPLGVSIDDDDGTLWVCDNDEDKIYNIEKDGTLISSFATSVFDAAATGPSGISTSNNNTLWYCDNDENKIYNIEKDGTLISSFATSVFDAGATLAGGISWDGDIRATTPTDITVAQDGTLWISDSDSDDIYHVTNIGALIAKFNTSEFDSSAVTPTGLSIATDGRLWVTDSTTDKIYQITSTGTLISSFASSVFDALATSPTGVVLATKLGTNFDLTNTIVPSRQRISVPPTVVPRRLALVIRHNTSDDKFELYKMQVESGERNLAFETIE